MHMESTSRNAFRSMWLQKEMLGLHIPGYQRGVLFMRCHPSSTSKLKYRYFIRLRQSTYTAPGP